MGKTGANSLTTRVMAVAITLMWGACMAFAQVPELQDLTFIKRLKLARAGDDVAALSVGRDYETGSNEARRDVVEAAKWYRVSALAGNLEAQFLLAKLITKGAPGLPVDVADGIKLLRSAAEKGYAPAQNELGLRLQKGNGIATNASEAAGWFEKASAQNFVSAQVNLGLLLVKGEGVTLDHKKAFTLFEKAASTGDDWGINNLGSMYEMGWGVARDLEKAKLLYRQAAEKGNAMAPLNLSRLGALQ